MRRLKFIILVLLFAAACETPAVLGPSVKADAPSASVATTSTSLQPAETAAENAGGGIMMGSGTESVATDTTQPSPPPEAGATSDGGILIGSGT